MHSHSPLMSTTPRITSSNTETCVRNIIVPFIKDKREQLNLEVSHPALVILDQFSGHSGETVLEVLKDNKILSVKVPGKCTDRLQPLHLSVE